MWLLQLHYMTINCLGIQNVEHDCIHELLLHYIVVEWGCVCDFLCEMIRYYHKEYHCHLTQISFLMDILHISWEVVAIKISHVATDEA